MNQKQKFIIMVEQLVAAYNDPASAVDGVLDADAIAYFELFKTDAPSKEKSKFTDNGKLILGVMREHETATSNLFKARDIAEFAFINSKSVSGAMTKLVNDGYADVISKSPNVYSLTDLGRTIDFEA